MHLAETEEEQEDLVEQEIQEGLEEKVRHLELATVRLDDLACLQICRNLRQSRSCTYLPLFIGKNSFWNFPSLSPTAMVLGEEK